VNLLFGGVTGSPSLFALVRRWTKTTKMMSSSYTSKRA